MTLPTPAPAAVRALLDAAGLTEYAAAGMIGMSKSALYKITRGDHPMRGSDWQLLQIMLTQSARDALPPPVIVDSTPNSGH